MQELDKLIEQMQHCRPVSWEQLPDIALYMDQLVGYMSRQLIDFASGEKLTSAMINNYIKDDLMPRADGKRYSKDHIAYLTAICIFKQVLSVRETKVLLGETLLSDDTSSFYGSLGKCLDEELTRTVQRLKTEMTKEEITDLVMHQAVSAYCQQLVCKRLIEFLRTEETAKTTKSKKNSEE
jgi:hypothetical protein